LTGGGDRSPFFVLVSWGLPSVALAKGGGKSGLHRVGRPGVVLGDFMFKHEGRKVPQKIDRYRLAGSKGEKVV